MSSLKDTFEFLYNYNKLAPKDVLIDFILDFKISFTYFRTFEIIFFL